MSETEVSHREATTGAAPPIVALNFKRIDKGMPIRSADLFASKWRFKFYGALWHRKGDQEWISLLAREWTAADGKRVFTALGKFSSHRDPERTPKSRSRRSERSQVTCHEGR